VSSVLEAVFQAQFSTEALGFDENETKFMSFVIMRWDTALTPINRNYFCVSIS